MKSVTVDWHATCDGCMTRHICIKLLNVALCAGCLTRLTSLLRGAGAVVPK